MTGIFLISRSIVETFSKENDANVEKCRRKCLRNIQYVDQDAFANIISQNFDFRSRFVQLERLTERYVWLNI